MSMAENVIVDVQLALDEGSAVNIPGTKQIQQWAAAAIDAGRQKKIDDVQITVRIVEEKEICQLNKNFRHKAGATNVLSFPFVPPQGIPADEIFNSLGDLVICAAVVEKEASDQGKNNIAHWAHMIIHGTLHLLGYDHQDNGEAFDMESLEKRIMLELGFPDPYKEI